MPLIAADNGVLIDNGNPNHSHGAEHNDAEFPGSPMNIFDELHGSSMVINSDSDDLDDGLDKGRSRAQTPVSEINDCEQCGLDPYIG